MLKETQREIVDTVISDFSKLGGATSQRAILLYLRKATEHPEHIGFHPDVTPCGCENGFRIKEEHGSTFTVERCVRCSDPERFRDIPSSYIE